MLIINTGNANNTIIQLWQSLKLCQSLRRKSDDGQRKLAN